MVSKCACVTDNEEVWRYIHPAVILVAANLMRILLQRLETSSHRVAAQPADELASSRDMKKPVVQRCKLWDSFLNAPAPQLCLGDTWLASLTAWWEMLCSKLIGPQILFFYFLSIGATSMKALEGDEELANQESFCEEMEQLRANLSPELYLSLVAQLGEPDACPWRNWDFPGAFFYCYTLVSTIGYGVFTPQTDGGKLFTIFYVLIGVPLFVLLVADLGKAYTELLLFWLFKGRNVKIRRKIMSHLDATKEVTGALRPDDLKKAIRQSGIWNVAFVIDGLDEADDGREEGVALTENQVRVWLKIVAESVVQRLHLLASLVLLLVYFSVVVTVQVTRQTDGWNVLDTVYWLVITFTTVGLGDYVVPLANENSLYGDFLNEYLVWTIGLGFFAMVIQSGIGFMQKSLATRPLLRLKAKVKPENVVRRCFRQPCCTRCRGSSRGEGDDVAKANLRSEPSVRPIDCDPKSSTG